MLRSVISSFVIIVLETEKFDLLINHLVLKHQGRQLPQLTHSAEKNPKTLIYSHQNLKIPMKSLI